MENRDEKQFTLDKYIEHSRILEETEKLLKTLLETRKRMTEIQ